MGTGIGQVLTCAAGTPLSLVPIVAVVPIPSGSSARQVAPALAVGRVVAPTAGALVPESLPAIG